MSEPDSDGPFIRYTHKWSPSHIAHIVVFLYLSEPNRRGSPLLLTITEVALDRDKRAHGVTTTWDPHRGRPERGRASRRHGLLVGPGGLRGRTRTDGRKTRGGCGGSLCDKRLVILPRWPHFFFLVRHLLAAEHLASRASYLLAAELM